MNPEAINTAKEMANSETAVTVAKRLWPTMLFLVVMSIITLLAAYFFNKDNETSKLIAFWVWFAVQTVVTGFGVHAFLTDTRILFLSNRLSPEDPSKGVVS